MYKVAQHDTVDIEAFFSSLSYGRYRTKCRADVFLTSLLEEMMVRKSTNGETWVQHVLDGLTSGFVSQWQTLSGVVCSAPTMPRAKRQKLGKLETGTLPAYRLGALQPSL